MRYLPSDNLSCLTGRHGDLENLEGLLMSLAELLEEIRINTAKGE
jgi:hypothetical protein